MERKLGHFPNGQELSRDFTPGVRFYFRYESLARHPNCVFDGVLPLKIKDEVVLKDWVYAIVIPQLYRNTVEAVLPRALKDRVLYVENDCRDIWEWSEKVYSRIECL